LAEKIKKVYPNAQFMMVTNGSLLDREKIDWFNRMGFSIGM
jgi:sulfatase maturation enzyme AslB (radical SAM superfamily)